MESRFAKNLTRLVVCGVIIGLYYEVSQLFLCEADLDEVCAGAATNTSLVLVVFTILLAFTIRSTRQFGITLITLAVIFGPLTHCGTYYFNQSGYREVSINFNYKLMNNVARRLDDFKRACGFYPSSSEGLLALAEGSPSCPQWRARPNIKDNIQDSYGSPFVYTPEGDPADAYRLVSYGADMEPGGDGDSEDIEMRSPSPDENEEAGMNQPDEEGAIDSEPDSLEPSDAPESD